MSAVSEPPRPQLRPAQWGLVAAAIGAWLVTIVALRLPPMTALAGAMLAGCCGGLAWRLRRRGLGSAGVWWQDCGWILVAMAMLGAAAAGVGTAWRTSHRAPPVVKALAARSALAEVTATIADDPRSFAGGAGRSGGWAVPVRISELSTTRVRVRAGVRGLVVGWHPAWAGLLPGQRIRVRAMLTVPKAGDWLRLTGVTVRADGAPQILGRPPWVQRAAGGLRAGLRDTCRDLPTPGAGLLPGLVLGDTSPLAPAVRQDFRTTGMTHLVAVSGSNVAVICGFVLLLSRWIFTRWPRIAPACCAGFAALALVGFVILVRPSPSVLRAAAMGAIVLLALVVGRPGQTLPALAAAVLGLLGFDPALALSFGFALSVAATGGIVWFAARWAAALRARRIPHGLAEALAVAAAAQVACAPIIAALAGGVSLVAVPANLLAAPAVPVATVLGVAATLLLPFWSGGAHLVAWAAVWPAYWLVLVARAGARLPHGTAPWPAGLVGGLALTVGLGCAFVALRSRRARVVLAVLVASAALGAIPVRMLYARWPPPGWVLVACDVGQGDALALSVAPGVAVVVDAGPDSSTVDACLRRLGVRAIPLWVASHFHADHVGGLPGVVRHRRLAQIAVPAYAEPAAAALSVARVGDQRRVPLTRPEPGWRFQMGGLELLLLAPSQGLRGTRSDPNNNSLWLQARTAGVTIMLPGDAEIEEQQQLLASSVDLRAAVLKVAHHGSRWQAPGLYAAIGAQVALVSVGARNDYGHPAPEVLDGLRGAGARVFRTDQGGDLAVVVRRGRGPPRIAVVSRGR